jgi:hypothetical protein
VDAHVIDALASDFEDFTVRRMFEKFVRIGSQTARISRSPSSPMRFHRSARALVGGLQQRLPPKTGLRVMFHDAYSIAEGSWMAPFGRDYNIRDMRNRTVNGGMKTRLFVILYY